MHELPIVMGLLGTIGRSAREHQIQKVTRIRIRVGELSDVVDECLQMYFDTASAGTVCEGAELEFLRNPAVLKCTKCGKEFPHVHSFTCPDCGGEATLVRGTGSGCYVENYEGE